MKIAVTTGGKDLSAPMESRFGRATSFLVLDDETGSFELLSNEQQLNAAQGAGIQAAQNVASTRAKVLISGHCGPKAYKVLNAAGIEVFLAKDLTVQAALDCYKEGSLKKLDGADVEEHWV